MRKILFLFCLLSISFSSFTQLLIPYKKGDLWRFSTLNRMVFIYPEYDKVEFFDKYGAKVWRDSLIGLINTSGKLIVEPKYEAIKPITKSIFKVQINEKWEIIDDTGNVLINESYDGIYDLDYYRRSRTDNWYFKVKERDNYGIIKINIKNQKGVVVTPVLFENVENLKNPFYKDSVKFFKIRINDKEGVIKVTREGYSTVIEPKFETLHYSRNSRKYYCQTNTEELTFNELGEIQSKVNLNDKNYEEDAMVEFDDSYLENRLNYPYYKLTYSGDLQGLITDRKERLNRNWIYVTDTIPAIYDTIITAYPHDNCFIVKKNNKWGAVTPKGEIIISPIYNELLIKSFKTFKYQNQNTQIRFIVRKGNKWGVVGNVGVGGTVSNNSYIITPFKYDSIILDQSKKYYIVSINGKEGVISTSSNKVIIEPIYTQISTKLAIHKGAKFFKVKLTENSDYVYIGEKGRRYFEE